MSTPAVESTKPAEDSSNEYCLNSTDIIISRTCPSMIIKSYNTAFLRASGYTAEELEGKRHNILRHPDMPAEAFEDMRKTIQAGRPWHGVIKNRRKKGNALGSYYWVDATITPIIENGLIVGYESIRYPASDAQKIKAERLYKGIREGKRKMPSTLDSLKPGKFQRMDLYLTLGVLSIISAIVIVLGILNQLSITLAVLASILGIFYFNKLRKYRLIDDQDGEELEAVRELSRGNFRFRIPSNSIFTEPLELIRARIASQSAGDVDCKIDDTILTALMDTIRGVAVYTDEDFKILRYSMSALNMQLATDYSVTDTDIAKYLPKSVHLGLKKKTDRQTTVLDIEGHKYDAIITPILVRGDVKGYLFLMYEKGLD